MDQSSGESSTNIQVGGNVSIGVTATEARQIALDVFKANFYDLSAKASQTVLNRAAEITDNFIGRFFDEIPQLSTKLEEPGVQSSMYEAQKGFVTTGDQDLQVRLLDALIERINSKERSLKQIALDEAIRVLPKLTQEQIDVLTLIFAIVYMRPSAKDLPSLREVLVHKILKFYPVTIGSMSISYLTHLQYSGCFIGLSEGSAYKPLEELLLYKYKGLFNKGFTEEEFVTQVDANKGRFKPLIIRCIQNPQLFQLNAMRDAILKEKIQAHGLEEFESKLMPLFNKTMSPEEVKDFLIKLVPESAQLFESWLTADLKTVRPTSVGLAIAISNYNRHTGEKVGFDFFI